MVRKANTEKKLYARTLLILIILAVLAYIYVRVSRPAHSAADAPATARELVLQVVPLHKQNVTLTSQYIGFVTPINSVDVVPNVSGYLDQVWVNGGQEVSKGDNLVLIDQREYKAALDAARAAVTQAKANFNYADTYYRRLKKVGTKAISKTELDNAQSQYLAAKGAWEEAQAEAAKAKVLYDYTVLQAPINGLVGNVELTKGNYVSPASTPLFKIIQYDPIRVVFSITDKEYLDEISRHPDYQLFNGEAIKLKLAGNRIYKNLGSYQYSGNEIDRSTNSIAIYADFANPTRELVANAYVDVLLERPLHDVYRIRQNYILMEPAGNYVYTVKNNQLLKTPVQLAGTIDNDYVVANRFADNEYLVIDKVGAIDKHTPVKIKVVSNGSASGEKK